MTALADACRCGTPARTDTDTGVCDRWPTCESADGYRRYDEIPGEVDFSDPSLEAVAAERLGNCYELACRYIAEPRGTDATLVHGTIQRGANPPLRHAWVEIGDEVFEPTSGHRMSAEAFAAYFHPTETVRYRREQVYVEMLRAETYGPWTEETR